MSAVFYFILVARCARRHTDRHSADYSLPNMFGFSLTSTVRREQERADKLEAEVTVLNHRLDEQSLREQTLEELAKAEANGRWRDRWYGAAGFLVLGLIAVTRYRNQIGRIRRLTSRIAKSETELQRVKTINQELKAFGHQKFAVAMLDVGDNLRRALNHIPQQQLDNDAELGNLHSGVSMALESFEK